MTPRPAFSSFPPTHPPRFTPTIRPPACPVRQVGVSQGDVSTAPGGAGRLPSLTGFRHVAIIPRTRTGTQVNKLLPRLYLRESSLPASSQATLSRRLFFL